MLNAVVTFFSIFMLTNLTLSAKEIIGNSTMSTNAPSLPFNATAVAASHSTLTGVLAGFALTALFLIIERTRDEDSKIRETYSKAMLLLFTAFLTGCLTSYLYSIVTGDSASEDEFGFKGMPKRGYFEFLFPSAIFAIHASIFLAGINSVFNAFGINDHIRRAARLFSIGVVIFSVYTIGDDLNNAAKFFGLKVQNQLLSIAIVILFLIFILMSKKLSFWRNQKKQAIILGLCYCALISSLIIAGIHVSYYSESESEVSMPKLVPAILFSLVSLLGAWTSIAIILDKPSKPSAKDAE